MQISSAFKTIFIAAVAQIILSCNNDKVKVQEVTLTDIKQEEKHVEPPPPPPPPPKIPDGAKKCYASDGLTYKTFITLVFDGLKNEVSGNVTSEELETGKKETTQFEGTSDGVKFTIKFKGNPPVVGAASEWTDKPWTIEQLPAKGEFTEKLHIIFNAKNYDTNKWENTDYQFNQVACK